MTGTREGGKRTARTNKRRHGEDYYKDLGRQGGKWDDPDRRPFRADPELAKRAGAIGGKLGRRKWTPEERRQHSKLLKEYWAIRKRSR